jgi:hypothetical protein
MGTEAKTLWKIGGVILLVIIVVSAVGYVLGWFGEAASVAQKEFGAKAALEKYEWFIDQANMIQKADGDITIFEKKLANIEANYISLNGEDKTKWDMAVKTLYTHDVQTAQTDLAAIVSNRNTLVRDYNSQSAKFNWAPFKGRSDYPPESFVEYK